MRGEPKFITRKLSKYMQGKTGRIIMQISYKFTYISTVFLINKKPAGNPVG